MVCGSTRARRDDSEIAGEIFNDGIADRRVCATLEWIEPPEPPEALD